MNPKLARLLMRLYPRAWRERYGDEFEELLIASPGGLRTSVNVVRSAVYERVFPTQGGSMQANPRSFRSIVRQPSAFLPMAMSLLALTVVLVSIATFGVVHETDEGATAHIWQILMAGQMPILAYFAIRWLPRAPRQTLCVLALQVSAVLAAMAPVFLLKL